MQHKIKNPRKSASIKAVRLSEADVVHIHLYFLDSFDSS